MRFLFQGSCYNLRVVLVFCFGNRMTIVMFLKCFKKWQIIGFLFETFLKMQNEEKNKKLLKIKACYQEPIFSETQETNQSSFKKFSSHSNGRGKPKSFWMILKNQVWNI